MKTSIQTLLIIAGYIPLFGQIYFERITLLEVVVVFFFSSVLVQIINVIYIDRVYAKKYSNNFFTSTAQTLQQIIFLCVVYLLGTYALYSAAFSAANNYMNYSIESFLTWLQAGFLSVVTDQSWVVVVIVVVRVVYKIYSISKASAKMSTNEKALATIENAWVRSVFPLTVLILAYSGFLVRSTERTVALILIGTALGMELIGCVYSALYKKRVRGEKK